MWLILTPAFCKLGGFLPPSLFCSPLYDVIDISCTAALGNLAQIGSISFLWLRISRVSFHLPSRIASIDWSVVCSHTMTGFQRLSQLHVCLGRSAGGRVSETKSGFIRVNLSACSSFHTASFIIYLIYLLIISGLPIEYDVIWSLDWRKTLKFWIFNLNLFNLKQQSGAQCSACCNKSPRGLVVGDWSRFALHVSNSDEWSLIIGINEAWYSNTVKADGRCSRQTLNVKSISAWRQRLSCASRWELRSHDNMSITDKLGVRMGSLSWCCSLLFNSETGVQTRRL